jgi:hypothetical protein
MITPYASIHGIELAGLMDVSDGGMDESGGERDIQSYSGPGQTSANVRENGYGDVTYSFSADSFERADIEDLVAEIKTMPSESEICPREADRCNYVAYGHATRPTILISNNKNMYHVDVKIVCRDNKLFGPDQGIEFLTDQTLPQTVSLANSGYYDANLDYLYLSGKYDASLGLTRDLRLQMGDYDLRLIDQLMGRDSFKMDRFGNAEHFKETEFPENYATLQAELGGSTFLNYGTNGSMGYQALLLDNSAKILFPFYGPLPIREAPYLEVVLSRLVGHPEVSVAYSSDVSDIDGIDFELKTGLNKIWIPDSEGEDFIAIGITTDTSSSCTISSIHAKVIRYVATNSVPVVAPDEDFDITVSDGEFSNHMLSGFQLAYRDVF